jgi:hypothetical protein
MLTPSFAQWLLHRSLRAFHWDDCLMLFIACTYTITCVSLNEAAAYNYVPYDAPESVQRMMGILSLLNETAYVTTLWAIKTSLLALYARMANFRFQMLVVRIMAVFVAISYIIVLAGLYGFFCHPINQYFSFSPTDLQCWTYAHYYILHLVLNVFSDIVILCIPLSLIWRSQMKRTKKIALCCVFGLGVGVIVVACLTKAFTLAYPDSSVWELWYMRECTIAVLVSNLPFCWPLVRLLLPRKERDNSNLEGSTIPNTVQTLTTLRTWGSIDLDLVDIADITDGTCQHTRPIYTPPDYTKGW